MSGVYRLVQAFAQKPRYRVPSRPITTEHTMPTNLEETIDALGETEARIKELEKKKKDLRASLGELDDGSYNGNRYDLHIKTQSRGTLDQDAVRALLSEQWVDEHTKISTYQVLRFSARNGRTGE